MYVRTGKSGMWWWHTGISLRIRIDLFAFPWTCLSLLLTSRVFGLDLLELSHLYSLPVYPNNLRLTVSTNYVRWLESKDCVKQGHPSLSITHQNSVRNIITSLSGDFTLSTISNNNESWKSREPVNQNVFSRERERQTDWGLRERRKQRWIIWLGVAI